MHISLTLHIIYTAHATRPFTLFALSLLRHTPCHIFLVSNGCTPAEEDHLQQLARDHPRLSFQSLSVATPLLHGHALNRLHDHCQEPLFAFVDSDIYAVGPFMPADLSGAVTCFLPPAAFWTQREQRFQQERHRFGCTYLAIYHDELLRDIRRRWNVGFDLYKANALTDIQRSALQTIGYVRQHYDTAKVLNALFAVDGHAVTFAAAGNLRHLGGATRTSLAPMNRLPPLRRLFKGLRLNWSKVPRALDKRRHRVQTSAYFATLLDALLTGQPLPDLPDATPYIRDRLQAMTTEIVALYTPAHDV